MNWCGRTMQQNKQNWATVVLHGWRKLMQEKNKEPWAEEKYPGHKISPQNS